MTLQQKLEFKKRLHKKAIEFIEQRITNAAVAMQSAQQAANEEEKSSAGDKYETSRAMSHIEKDMFARQVAENKKELASLLAINFDKLCDNIMAGSIAESKEFIFFIGAGLGSIDFEGKAVYFLSANAPLADLLYNKKKGDTFRFGNKELMIQDIY